MGKAGPDGKGNGTGNYVFRTQELKDVSEHPLPIATDSRNTAVISE